MNTPPDLNMLLIDAPIGRHFAQLVTDPQARVQTVSLFVETGLRRGNGVVVVAPATGVELFLERLSRNRVDPEAFRRAGQLAVYDAETVLGQFMRDGMPDWVEFRRTIGGILESVRAFGRSTMRVYGEMVNILWREGRVKAAIRLEECWNELGRLHPFSLFCSYVLDSHNEESYAAPLHEIGRTHSDIIVMKEDEQFRAMLDAAIKDIFGTSLSQMFLSDHEENPGEHRLPDGQRAVLWMMRNKSTKVAEVLERARRHHQITKMH